VPDTGTNVDCPGAEMLTAMGAEIVTAVPGNKVYLPCRVSDHFDVQWRNNETIIYSNRRLQRNFTGRFSLGSTQDVYHALIISESKPSDTGIYECTNNNGSGRSHYVFLFVSGAVLLFKQKTFVCFFTCSIWQCIHEF
jgi:Immunoglobulin V-set domain